MFKRITSFIITLILIISAVGMGLKPIPANAKNNKVSENDIVICRAGDVFRDGVRADFVTKMEEN
jgi:hypothetical protein